MRNQIGRMEEEGGEEHEEWKGGGGREREGKKLHTYTSRSRGVAT